MNTYTYELTGKYKNGDSYCEKLGDVWDLHITLKEICDARDKDIKNSDSPIPESIHIECYKESIRD